MRIKLSELISLSDVQQFLQSFSLNSRVRTALLDLGSQTRVAAVDSGSFETEQPLPSEWIKRRWLNETAQTLPEVGTGLYEYAYPIQIEGQELAVVILGPVRHEDIEQSRLQKLAQVMSLEEDGFLEAFQKTVLMPPAQAEGWIRLLGQWIERLVVEGLKEQRRTIEIQSVREQLEQQQQAHYQLKARLQDRTGELERVNAALQESERRFQVALMDTPVVVFNQDLDLRYTWIYNPQNYADQPVVGKTDQDLFSPQEADYLTSLKHQVMRAGRLTRAEVSMTVGGKTLAYDMTLDPLYDSSGQVIGLTCAATDITERKQNEDELRRRLAEIEGVQRIAKGLLQKIGLDEVLEIVCAEAMQLTGATGSAVLLLEENGWLQVTHRAGSPVDSLDRLPVEGSLAGQAVQTGQHIWIRRQESTSQVPWTEGLVSLLAVPLKVEQQTLGVLNLLNKPGSLTQEDLRILNLFADQAAIIIEHVRLQQQAEQLALIEERQRLARELHDSVTQALYSLTLYADAARLALSRQQWEALERNLYETRSLAREAMADMRLLVFELRPFSLEKEGLVSALHARLSAVEDRSGLRTEMRVEGERRLPLGLEEELYRIAQEGLNNVIKHARARVVSLRLQYGSQAVQLDLEDDGIGFDSSAAMNSGGIGLQGIQERVERWKGQFTLDSTPGQGTRLKINIPLSEKD